MRATDAARRALARHRGNFGWCSVCEARTLFVELGAWLRDEYLCIRCRSIPRNRAFMLALGEERPDWRRATIHESSPSGAASAKLARECPQYTSSQWLPEVERGAFSGGVRCEDVQALTLADSSVDIFVTQDVFEHVLEPERGFAEVARVLRPGGAHVFTVPVYQRASTHVRAEPDGEGGIRHVDEPDYHVNPVDPAGSLVVREWGLDLPEVVDAAGPTSTRLVHRVDRKLGIDGEFAEVVVSKRLP